MLNPSSTKLDARLQRELHGLTAPGRRRLRRGLGRVSRYLVPNPPTRAVDWIQDHLVIPNGSRPGQVELDIVQRTILDLMQRPDVHTVVWLKPPRAGSSTMTALAMLFQSAYDGADVIFYERSDPEAQNFHDKKLRPILDASTKIAHLVRPDSRSGIQDSWSDLYLVNGAAIQHRGVQTDSNFKAIRARWVFIDEAGDKAFLASGVESEGNKAGQARTRHAEYPDGTIYIGGTPTTPGCVVVVEYEAAAEKLQLMMKLPCCDGAPQPFLRNVSQAFTKEEIIGPGLKFRCDDADEVVEIGYECAHCKTWLPETSRNVVMEAGAFLPKPGVKGGTVGAVGIDTWAIHAKDPGLAWPKIIEKYRAQLLDPSQQQDWQNLWLAQAFVPLTEGKRDPDELEARCEVYGAKVPDGVLELFAGIDFQEGSERRGQLPRVEIVVIGIGANEEKWVIERKVIDRVWFDAPDEDGVIGRDWDRIDPVGPEAARLIWEYLDEGFAKADGTVMHCSRVGVDTGYETTKVLSLCAHAESRRRKLVPFKGRKEAMSEFGKRAPIIGTRPDRSDRSGLKAYLLGTQGAKDYIAQCLDLEVGRPFSFHFPDAVAGTDFFKQLTAEELLFDPKNPDLCRWSKPKNRQHDSNEVLDCIVLSLGAFHYQKAKSMRTRKLLALDPEAAAAKPRTKVKSLRPAKPEPVPEVSPEQKAAAARLQAVVSKLPPELRAALGAGIKSTVDKLHAQVAAAKPAPAAPRSAREFLTESLRSSRRRDDDDRGRGDSRRGEERTISRRRGGAADILDW